MGALGLRAIGRPGQGEQIGRGVDGALQEAPENLLGHGDLVVRNGQAALSDVEDARSRAPVIARVVQNPLQDAVGLDVVGDEAVAVRRQGQRLGDAGLIEDEGGPGQARAGAGAGQVGVEEVLDAVVRRAVAVGQAAGELALAGDDR